MPKQSPIPKYRLHKASGQACVVIDGRWFYLGQHGSVASRAEYDRLVAEWLANNRALPSPTSELTIAELILRYWRHANVYYRKNGEPTGEVGKIRDAMRPLKQLYGRTPAAVFGPLRLKAVREKMISEKLARTTINSRVGTIKRMFRWAVENELVPPSVYQGLQAVAGLRQGRSDARETERVLPAPEGHVRAVLPHVSREVEAMVQLQLLTGMRPGEVVSMRACDIEMSNAIWVYRPPRHKIEHHGIQREILLGPRAQSVVRGFLSADARAYLFSPEQAEAERTAARRAARRTPMTPSQARRRCKTRPQRAPGTKYAIEAYRRAVARACDKAGVPRWSPNQLRHAHATAVRKQFGLEAAQVLLGHARLETTQVYAERNRALAAEIIAKIG